VTIGNHKPPSNRRLQLTAFGARDRGFFEAILWSAPWRQLKRKPLGRFVLSSTQELLPML